MFPLFETIRVENGQIMHGSWHEYRFASSYHQYFGKKAPFDLFEGITIPQNFQSGLVKLRIAYGKKDRQVQFEDYQIRRINRLKLVSGDDLDYSLKFSNRTGLEILLQQKGDCDDVLIIKNGQVTDSSYCNIVLFDGKNWVTPKNPLLNGTARERLLSIGKITTSEIHVSDLKQFDSFKLINAMRDFEQVEAIGLMGIEF